MATAKHLHLHSHLKDSSAPNIDVYSTPVIVYEGETFDWTISGQDGQASVTVEPVPGQTWPFSQSSFSVSRGPGTQATVPAGSAGSYQFQCNPAAPTSPQTLDVAKVYNPCDESSGGQGQYFAWTNTQNAAIVVNPAPDVTWPLVQSAPLVILGNSTKIVQVASDATVGNHDIAVTLQQGGSAACPNNTSPVIIVTAPGIPK